MKKSLKFGIYLFLAAGLAAILLVVVNSLIDPNRKQARIEQNDKGAQAVLGQMITLQPRPARPGAAFLDQSGVEFHLSDFEGKVVLLNLWATWCEPCVKEMPSLDALQARLGGDDFVVLALSEDRSKEDALAFFTQNKITNLTFYQDKGFEVVQQLYVKNYPSGLPITVLYDRQGKELLRLSGGFDWVSELALARIEQAISTPVLSK